MKEEQRKKLSEIAKTRGFGKWMRGRKFSAETRSKMSLIRRGKKPYEMTNRTKIKISEALKGKTAWNKGLVGYKAGTAHYRWKENKTPFAFRRRMRSWLSWKNWRTAVFIRDNFRCRECGTAGYLEPHHIISLKKDLHLAFNINNGVALCRPCHKKTMGKEAQFEEKYFSLIGVDKSMAYC